MLLDSYLIVKSGACEISGVEQIQTLRSCRNLIHSGRIDPSCTD